MRRLITAILVILSVAACKKDDTILDHMEALGDIGSGVIYGDNGIRFHVAKQSCEDGYQSQDRVMFSCNVLRKLSEREYDIELLEWSRVLKKDILLSDDITDDAAIGHDPIAITNMWVSGIYLNMAILTTFIVGSETKHVINLVLENDTDDTLRFSLRHNAGGESVGASEDLDFDNTAFGKSYVSFPIQQFIPRGGARNIVIEWDWHKPLQDGMLLKEVQTNASTATVRSLYSE